MTLHEIIEKIKDMERDIRFPEDLYEAGKKDAYCAVLDFLTKAEAEKEDVDLEKKLESYFEGMWPGTETAEQCNTDMHFTPPAIMRLARHFAEWGADHLRDTTKMVDEGLDKARFLKVLDQWEAHAVRGMRNGATAYHQGKIALITDLRDWINREG